MRAIKPLRGVYSGLQMSQASLFLRSRAQESVYRPSLDLLVGKNHGYPGMVSVIRRNFSKDNSSKYADIMIDNAWARHQISELLQDHETE